MGDDMALAGRNADAMRRHWMVVINHVCLLTREEWSRPMMRLY
jgi:hypothetical protein